MADRLRTPVDWEDLRVFLALARHGSLSAAARALAVNHATVARRMRSLERGLGEKLAERRPEGYVLTAAGTRTLDAASDMETAALTLGHGEADGMPSGLVRVNAPPGLSIGFLTARLAAIAAKHIALDLELATNLRSVSLDRHEADIAVRLDRPADGDMIARPIGAVHYGFYGTEEACQRAGVGKELHLIGFNEADAFVPDAVWLTNRFPKARLVFRGNNHFVHAVAARSGIGIALLPHYIGRTEPTLRLIDLGTVPNPRDIFLLNRRRDRTAFAIRVVADEIIQLFADERTLFE